MVAEAAMYLVPMYGMTGLIVVDTPVEVAVRRLVQHRGMVEADAHARVARQLPRETRLEHADFVIDNGSTVDALNARVQQAWDWIRSLPDATPELAPAASSDRVDGQSPSRMVTTLGPLPTVMVSTTVRVSVSSTDTVSPNGRMK